MLMSSTYYSYRPFSFEQNILLENAKWAASFVVITPPVVHVKPRLPVAKNHYVSICESVSARRGAEDDCLPYTLRGRAPFVLHEHIKENMCAAQHVCTHWITFVTKPPLVYIILHHMDTVNNLFYFHLHTSLKSQDWGGNENKSHFSLVKVSRLWTELQSSKIKSESEREKERSNSNSNRLFISSLKVEDNGLS